MLERFKEVFAGLQTAYGQTKSTLGHLAYDFKEGKKQCENCQLAVIVHSDKGVTKTIENKGGQLVFDCDLY